MKLPSRRHSLIAGSTVAALAAVAVPVSLAFAEADKSKRATAQCEIATLPGPEGNAAGGIKAVSPSGEYMIGTADKELVLWHGDEPTRLPADARLHPSDVNSSGEVVGYRYNDDEIVGFHWQDGELTDLAFDAPGSQVQAAGINENGQIVGNLGHSLDDMFVAEAPVMWESATAEGARGETLDGLYAEAGDLNEDGNVFGDHYDPRIGDEQPWQWSLDGAGEPLELGGDSEEVQPEFVADTQLLASTGATQGVFDLAASGEPSQVGMYSAKAVDANGRTYGEEWDSSDIPSAVMEVDGEIIALPQLDESHPDDRHDVRGASWDGTVLGGVSSEDGTPRPVKWTCE